MCEGLKKVDLARQIQINLMQPLRYSHLEEIMTGGRSVEEN